MATHSPAIVNPTLQMSDSVNWWVLKSKKAEGKSCFPVFGVKQFGAKSFQDPMLFRICNPELWQSQDFQSSLVHSG
jgi:hypothetical protein